MSRRSLWLAATLCVVSLTPGPSFAESRLALVIGNSAYRSASPLLNPSRDAKAVTDLLQSAGFEVTSAADLTQDDMRRTIREFALKIASRGKDTVAAVYYAGHGVQVGGENFLIPVDATIRRQAEVPLQGVRFDDLMNLLEAVPTKARIVILDACRNNPFEEMKKTVGRGLAMVNAPVGSVVAYSTSPGTEAEDGEGTNSPFTAAFVEAAKRPGVPIEQIFKDVRLTVHNATAGRQTPWEVVSLTTNFTFFPATAKGDAPVIAERTSPAAERTQPVPARTPAKDDGTPAAKVTPVSLAGKPPEVTAESDAVRVAYWTKLLRPLGHQGAYEVVVREDNVDAYRAYVALFPKAPVVTRIRTIVERRVEMHAWYTAVTVNSEASYKYFLGRYGNSDLAITAQGLMERAATRALLASTDPAALGLPPCNCPVVPTRKAAPKAAPKPAAKPASRAARRAPAEVEEVVEPVRSPIGIGGIGIGIGVGGGRGMIGDGPRRPTGPVHSPSGNYRR